MMPESGHSSETPVVLLLEDGTKICGRAFGATRAVAGEVVFNTGMTGYIEALTDPSYRGQILILTYPIIGNYGVPAPRPQSSIAPPYESGTIQVQGLVVQNYISSYSHHAARRSLGEWLLSSDVPALTGVDTRYLTQRLREHGTMRGWLLPGTPDKHLPTKDAFSVDMRDEGFELVAPSNPIFYEGGELQIALVDVGAKDNIVRSLLKRGASVNRIPWHTNILKSVRHADAVIIGNGPGDPKNLGSLIGLVRDLLASYRKPIFGICLGHQILALAAGADTFKLPFGHRSVNQPVQSLLNRHCYITSQNHGYAVRDDSLSDEWEPWFVNINDGTNEGFRSRTRPILSVQFHPEASPGPRDTGFLFDEFIRLAQTGAASS